MIKPASLRAALLAANPYLRTAADSLHVFMDKGSLSATLAGGAGFAYNYTLTIVITDHQGHPDSIFAPLIAWVATHQPDILLDQSRDAIEFDAEPLGESTYDIEIRLPLTERVILKQAADGTLLAEHLPHPGYDHTPPGIEWQLFIRGAELHWPPNSADEIEVP